MKKNLTKLALSGAALAAVAATLGTSTYAWYTTNPTVSANNIVAGTSDTGSSSIFISKDSDEAKNWSSSVTLTNADFVSADPSLTPLSYATAGQFKSVVTNTGALGAASNPGNSVAQVTLYFKSSKVADNNAQAIYIKSIQVVNTTADADAKTAGRQMPTADNLLYNRTHGTPAAKYTADEVGVTSDDATYSVDFRDALSMAVYNADSTDRYAVAAVTTETFATLKANLYKYVPAVGSTPASYASAKDDESFSSTTTYYKKVKGYDAAFTIANKKVNTTTYAAPDGVLSTGKAQEYYDEVMDTDLASDAKSPAGAMASKTAIGVCPTNGTDYITVNFYIYLDGASQFCYDACQGQQFAIDLQFTSDVSVAL